MLVLEENSISEETLPEKEPSFTGKNCKFHGEETLALGFMGTSFPYLTKSVDDGGTTFSLRSDSNQLLLKSKDIKCNRTSILCRYLNPFRDDFSTRLTNHIIWQTYVFYVTTASASFGSTTEAISWEKA